MASRKSCIGQMTHNSPRQVGSADYLDFQTLSGVETLRRRVAPQPPR
jgi:hypothetical protein